MKKTFTALALAVLTMAATAAPVSVTINGFEHGTAPTGTMTVNPPGPFNTNSTTAAVSALRLSVDDGSGPFGISDFLAYCIELFAPTANFGNAANYVQNTSPALGAFSIPFSTLQNDRLTKLFVKNGTLDGSTADSTASAAMQLAIWEIVYDGSASGFGDLTAGAFGLGAGEFYSTSVTGARTVAETLLNGLDGYDVGNFTATFTSFNSGGSKTGKQDFLSVSLNSGGSCDLGNNCDVPEPGSLALAGLGLLGLFAARRKAA